MYHHKQQKQTIMNKGQMINEIIGVAKNEAFLKGIEFNGGDLFFSLAFRTVKELKQICKKLNISTKPAL